MINIIYWRKLEELLNKLAKIHRTSATIQRISENQHKVSMLHRSIARGNAIYRLEIKMIPTKTKFY